MYMYTYVILYLESISCHDHLQTWQDISVSSVSKTVIPKVPGHRTNAPASGRFDRFIAASKLQLFGRFRKLFMIETSWNFSFRVPFWGFQTLTASGHFRYFQMRKVIKTFRQSTNPLYCVVKDSQSMDENRIPNITNIWRVLDLEILRIY